jgi:hypothetical protein
MDKNTLSATIGTTIKSGKTIDGTIDDILSGLDRPIEQVLFDSELLRTFAGENKLLTLELFREDSEKTIDKKEIALSF